MMELSDEIADKMFKFLGNFEEIHIQKVSDILIRFFIDNEIELNSKRITVVKCLQYNTENYFFDQGTENEKLLLVSKLIFPENMGIGTMHYIYDIKF